MLPLQVKDSAQQTDEPARLENSKPVIMLEHTNDSEVAHNLFAAAKITLRKGVCFNLTRPRRGPNEKALCISLSNATIDEVNEIRVKLLKARGKLPSGVWALPAS